MSDNHKIQSDKETREAETLKEQSYYFVTQGETRQRKLQGLSNGHRHKKDKCEFPEP